ncbi:MAG: radical SAM/SPASM domain-containing protein [Candidatus Wallbacteria bacterium]|nr:radical SAM/SPASM domain-containing protein [Candidatus Wallbacteria bacterium]
MSLHTTLILELTNFCDLNCIMCALPGMRRKRGFMNSKLLGKILADLKNANLKFNMLLPFWSGESTLHPQFPELLSMILTANYDRSIADGLGLDTNLNSWTPETIDLLLSSGQFVVLHFSLDAARAGTYARIRRCGNYETAVACARLFLRRRKALGMRFPHFVFQFIVMEENQDEAAEFANVWQKELKVAGCEPAALNYFYDQPAPITGDTIFIRRCDAPCGETVRQLRLEELHTTVVKRLIPLDQTESTRLLRTNEFRPDGSGTDTLHPGRSRQVCSGPFTHIAVRFDGSVTLCCQDTEAELCVGNASEESLAAIWQGPKAENLRQRLRSGDYPDRCRNCFNQVYP